MSIGPIKRFDNGIGADERHFLREALRAPLSGYLAGKPRGGELVCRLEDEWAETFHVKHAIACNSATSGMLAAAFAIGLGPGDDFICPAMTMSATCAAPMFTGATPVFSDVKEDDFAGNEHAWGRSIRAEFVTNLFGHPARLHMLRERCDKLGRFLIEDNAQSPFAWENGKMAGTIGHIGVFSLNVHKPLQCGEGGVIVTNDDGLAERMRNFINHGENADGPIGLNLRMPELCAAVALGQLERHEELLGRRVDQAEAILAAIGDIDGIRRPIVREGCTHTYYTVPFLIRAADGDLKRLAKVRENFCRLLESDGVPIVQGYVPPLYRLPAFAEFARPCPQAESLHDARLFYLENCQWSFNANEIERIGDTFKRTGELLWK